MALAGKAAVAIWNDVDPGAREDFVLWHNGEHIPERVDIRGFLRGRRWRATNGATEFFTLYEVKAMDVLSGPDYLARLNAPTAMTAEMMPRMPNAARVLCAVACSLGRGIGGFAATVRLAAPPDSRAASELTSAGRQLLAADPHLVGMHLLVRDADASARQIAEAKLRRQAPDVPDGMLLVEGSDGNRVEAAASALAARLAEAGPVANYRLEICVDARDPVLG